MAALVLLGATVATFAGATLTPDPGVAFDDDELTVIGTSPGSPAWRDGVRPGDKVVLMHRADEPGGWSLQVEGGGMRTGTNAVAQTARLRETVPAAVAGLGLGLLAMVLAARANRIGLALVPAAAALAAIPLLYTGSLATALIAVAAAALIGGAAVLLVDPGATAARIAAVAAGAFAVAWLGAVLAVPAAFDAVDAARLPLAVVLSGAALWIAVDMPGVAARLLGPTGPRLFDLVYLPAILTLSAGLALAGLVNPLVAATIALVAVLAYPATRRAAAGGFERLLVGPVRRQAEIRAVEDERSRVALVAQSACPGAPPVYLRGVIENYTDGTPASEHWHDQDVTTAFDSDCAGQRTSETRRPYRADGTGGVMLTTGWTYDTAGNQTAEIRNWDNGTVAKGTADETPDAATNARTDLTTAFGYDTAGNQVSVADPRRAIALAPPAATLLPSDYITGTTFDALGAVRTSVLPTTPGQADCAPAPACRTTTTYTDELGLAYRTTGVDGTDSATVHDAGGRAVETWQDDDGAGASAARLTGRSGYDAAGRVVWSEDAAQATDPAGGIDPGRTETAYDELGRAVQVTEAAGSASPDAA